MNFGEIVLVRFPFTDDTAAKKRPALVILDSDDGDLLLARVSSQPFETEFEVEIGDWLGAGLRLPSWVRVHKLATLHKSLIDRSLGQLAPADLEAVQERLKDMVRHLDDSPF